MTRSTVAGRVHRGALAPARKICCALAGGDGALAVGAQQRILRAVAVKAILGPNFRARQHGERDDEGSQHEGSAPTSGA